MHGGVINEKAVLSFAVLSQRLTMVAGEHDESVFVKLQLAQASKE